MLRHSVYVLVVGKSIRVAESKMLFSIQYM